VGDSTAAERALITSKNNRKVVDIRKLRARKERELTGLFLVEGIRLVGEAVQLGADVKAIVVAPELLDSPFGRGLVETAEERGVPRLDVSAGVFASLSLREGPQGLLAVVRQRWAELGSLPPPAEESVWVALDSVQDPGNLGSILRTCDAVGASGVILIGGATDPYDPTAVRASMGSVLAQSLVRADYDGFFNWASRGGWRVVGASGGAVTDYRQADFGKPLVVLMGGERQGLPEEVLQRCDATVRIPMTGRCDSLNLAVATGVLLYEVFRQRHPPGQEMRPGRGESDPARPL